MGLAAAAAASTAYQGISAKASSDQSYEYTRRLQKHDFNFQREMWDKMLQADNTAIQRRMADANEAGLNANLLFNNGGTGASTPSVSGGSGGSVSMQPAQTDLMTAMQVSMQKERQDAEIDALGKQTEADVELKNAQAALTMKQAGYTQKEIDFYLKHGVFPGATISGGAFGANASVPVGLKYQGTAFQEKKRRDFKDMTKYLNL